MKRTILKLSTLFLFCACAMVEEKDPAALPHNNVITARIAETPLTKTHLSPDNDSNIRKVLWSKGDKILLSGSYEQWTINLYAVDIYAVLVEVSASHVVLRTHFVV